MSSACLTANVDGIGILFNPKDIRHVSTKPFSSRTTSA